MPHPRALATATALATLLLSLAAAAPASAATGRTASPNACADFDAFANRAWRTAHPLPAGSARVSALGLMQQANEARLRTLLADVAKAPRTDAERLLGAFWTASLDTSAMDAASSATLANALKPLDGLRRARDLPKVSAALHQLGLAPMVEFLRLEGDPGGLAASPAPLGLGDPALYTGGEPALRELQGRYRAYVETLLRASGLPEAELSAASEAVMQIETQLAQAMQSAPGDSREAGGLRAQDRRYAALGLAETLKRLDAEGDDLVVLVPGYFATLQRVAAAEPPERLRVWLRFRVLDRLAPMLAQPFRDAHTDFQVRVLRGIDPLPGREEAVIGVIRRALPALLDHVAGERWAEAPLRERATAVATAVQAEAATRDARFGEVRLSIAEPAPFDASGLRFEPADAAGNVLRLARWREARAIAGKGFALADVPATRPLLAFDAGTNTLRISAAALAPPVLGAQPGATDWGAFGALFGHELSKAVDAGTRGAALGPLYNGYEATAGTRVNGSRTLPMNRADLAGLEFAWAAFAKAQPRADAATKKAFFSAWAGLWAEQASSASLREDAATSAYAPGKWRVNGPLSQLPAFGETFGCRVGAAMRAARPIGVWR